MNQAMTQRRTTAHARRSPRVNAPVRRRQQAGSIPDVLMAMAFGGWAMAIILVSASFGNDAITAGEAGPSLARIFAGTLAVAALLVFLLGIAMLRETRFIAIRIAYAAVVGAAGGALETVLLLDLAGYWMAAPLLLALLLVRPVRERVLQGVGFMPRGDGLR